MLISEFVQSLHVCCPPTTAMEGDRLGLLVQSGRSHIERMLICVDVTRAVIEEAIEKRVDTILTFHPLIFRPLTSIKSDDRVGECIELAISSGIAIISAHTNIDAHPRGTNAVFASRLGWRVSSLLVPDLVHAGHGMGVVCEIQPTPLSVVIDAVHRICGSPVRWNAGATDTITSIAVVCGSGSSFLSEAMKASVDAFVTADVRYHTFLEAEGTLSIIDPGHFEMEQFVPLAMRDIVVNDVVKMKSDVEVIVSEISTNPVRYR